MTVYKVTLCRYWKEDQTKVYPSKQSATTSLRNHKRMSRCDKNRHGIEEYELKENEWVCEYCNCINTAERCSSCNKVTKHSYSAYPNTEEFNEKFTGEILREAGIK